MRADPVFTSYSANFEDVLLHRVFGGRSRGAYLDVGASDPVRGNDTKALYDRGWSGVNLVDPALLPRFARVRPRDRGFGAGRDAVPPDAGPIALVRLAGGAALRTTLRDVDWERLTPDLVVAEVADRRTGRRGPGPASVLERHGYDLAHFDGLNEFHVKRGFRGAEGAFALPPNLFDRFVLYRPEDASEEARAERLALDNADLRHETERLRASVAALTADMLALNQDLDSGLTERAELHGLRGVAEECVRLHARVLELDAYASKLETDLGRDLGQALDREGRVRAELDHVRGLYEFMTVQHGHINALHGQVLVRYEQALAQYDRAEAERQRLAAVYKEEHALRRALEASTSWRLTRPLRTVVKRVRGR